jgi:hypothetical protein
MSPESLKILEENITAEFGCTPAMGEALTRYMLGEDDSDVFDYLYDRLMDKMPYGTAKARDGDPYSFIADYMEDLFGDLVLELDAQDPS